MSSSAIWARFTHRLKVNNMTLYNGENVHSTRRGSMIEATQNNAGIEEVQDQAMIRSKPIAMKYIDTTRPTRYRPSLP